MDNVNKTSTGMLMLGAAFLAAGCVIGPESEADPLDSVDSTEASANWTEGLTIEEVVAAMPITADYVQPEQAEAAVANGIGARSLAATASEVKVEWELPIEFVKELLKKTDMIPWNVSMKIGDGSWEELDANVEYTIDVERDVYRYFWFFGLQTISESLVTIKVDMADHNLPATTAPNIVSFFVFSDSIIDNFRTSTLHITILPETDAEAPSTLSMEFGGPFPLFNGIHELDLPAEATVEGSDLSPNLPAFTMVRFIMTSDFSDPMWGFEGVTTVTRGSNSSYCKVTMEDETADAWHLKYSFEDLPITELSSEPSHSFDYNDLVFVLDIPKAPN